MIELSRNSLYAMMNDDIEKHIKIPDSFREIYLINYTILNNLEDVFLANKSFDNKGLLKITHDEFILLLSKNLTELKNMNMKFIDTSSLIRKLEKLLTIMKDKNMKPQNMFNKLLKLIIELSDNYLTKTSKREFKIFKDNVRDLHPVNKKCKKVFLSYAYKDLLYTISLYFFFFNHGILLYVDWMHNDNINDGASLKETLHKELVSSENLLFLRTINSELMLRGNQFIRPWCSWETGNFYNKNGQNQTEKYFLSLYGELPYDNLQLHGFHLLTGVNTETLVGHKLWYK